MKHLLLIVCLVLAANRIISQIVTATVTPDYQVSTGGIGPFKTGMGKTAIEKILNTKLKLPKSAIAGSYEYDTIKATYKEMDVQLVFGREYTGVDTISRVSLYSVQSSCPLIKTKSGVGIGDDKMKIVKTYEQYRLTLLPEWTSESKPNPKRGTVTLYDNESPKVLIFYLDNNIITRVESTAYEGE